MSHKSNQLSIFCSTAASAALLFFAGNVMQCVSLGR